MLLSLLICIKNVLLIFNVYTYRLFLICSKVYLELLIIVHDKYFHCYHLLFHVLCVISN